MPVPAAPYRSTSLWALLQGILEPWIFLSMSLPHIPSTILSLSRTLSFRTLLTWSRFRPLWFASFWSVVGPNIRKANGPRINALLQGRVHGGKAVSELEARHPGIGGTVLEIGAGSGLWVGLFAPEHCTRSSTMPENGQRTEIRRVYGVEPNLEVYEELKENVQAAGLEGTYEILPMGVEDALAEGRIEEGSVDCIVSVLCLCGIPEPEKNIGLLYKCLKPGGRWYAFEHVRTFDEQGRWMRMYQAFVNLFWPLCLGGCNIDRDTVSYLERAGTWSNIDLAQPPNEDWFHTVPHVFGILTK